jgi:hypothetical protein
LNQAKGIIPDVIVKPALPEEEKTVQPPKLPSEKDLDRHLTDNKEQEKTKKEEAKEKKPNDPQLERAVELLKSWEIFKKHRQRKIMARGQHSKRRGGRPPVHRTRPTIPIPHRIGTSPGDGVSGEEICQKWMHFD